LRFKSQPPGAGSSPLFPGMSNQRGLSTTVRTNFESCGIISKRPAKFFDWKLRQGAAPIPPREFFVFVFDNVTGEKLPVPAALSWKIIDVKEALVEQIRMQPSEMKFSFHARILEDHNTLLHYGIQDRECIHLTRRHGGKETSKSLQLTIRTISDNPRPLKYRMHVSCRATDKVFDVKQQLETLLDIPAGEQRLSFQGRTLANEKTLEQYGISDSSSELELICPFSALELPLADLERNTRLAKRSAMIQRSDFPVTVNELWPEGQRRVVCLNADSKIQELKEKLCEWSGLNSEDQVLFHRGRVLVDELTTNYYNIDGGSFLDVAVSGGAPTSPMVAVAMGQGACPKITDSEVSPTIGPKSVLLSPRRKRPVGSHLYNSVMPSLTAAAAAAFNSPTAVSAATLHPTQLPAIQNSQGH